MADKIKLLTGALIIANGFFLGSLVNSTAAHADALYAGNRTCMEDANENGTCVDYFQDECDPEKCEKEQF